MRSTQTEALRQVQTTLARTAAGLHPSSETERLKAAPRRTTPRPPPATLTHTHTRQLTSPRALLFLSIDVLSAITHFLSPFQQFSLWTSFVTDKTPENPLWVPANDARYLYYFETLNSEWVQLYNTVFDLNRPNPFLKVTIHSNAPLLGLKHNSKRAVLS